MTQNTFQTLIVVSPEVVGHAQEYGVADQWNIKTREHPSERFRFGSDGKTVTEFTSREHVDPVPENDRRGHELLLCARSHQLANEVLSLIRGGTLLANPDFSKVSKPFGPIETEESKLQEVGEALADEYICYSKNVLFGLGLAQRASDDEELVYATEKWKFSLSLDSFTPQSAHPRHGQKFRNQYQQRRHQVHAAMAIVSAYSVIEELGLEIRASAEKPRFIKGEWNEEVIADVKQRLRDEGIEPDSEIEWLQRGPEKPLDDELKHPALDEEPSEWREYTEVSDLQMRIIEAIQRSAYLRNRVASHKLARTENLAQYLGPYEVYNVQSVARHLLLRRSELLDQRSQLERAE